MVRSTGVQSQVESYQRLKKIVLDAALLNTQHQEMEYSPSLHLGVVAIEKGALRSPSTRVANFLL